MSKLVIAVFEGDRKAQEGVVALRDLHREANATLYGTAVVRRDAESGLVIVQPTDQGSIPLGVGAIVKRLAQLFQTRAGGTHASDAGSAAPHGRSSRDVLRTDAMSDDSLAELARAMHPSNFAVLAEVSEDCAARIDTRMLALGGNVMRVQRENATADVITKETAALMENVHEWRADHAAIKARAMERNLATRIDATHAKLRRIADADRARQLGAQEEVDTELRALQEEAALATTDIRSRIEERLGEVRRDLAERASMLTRAYELTQAALHP